MRTHNFGVRFGSPDHDHERPVSKIMVVGFGHTSDPEANTLTVKFQGHSGH